MIEGLRYRFGKVRDRLAVTRSLTRMSGPARIDLAPDQVGLVLLARDVEWFLPAYLDHHFALGVAHVLIVDNGSMDRTLDIARRDRVTVLRSVLPVRRYESMLRAMAAARVFRGGWTMFADADEMAQLPFATPLPRLLRYCNARGFTAVLGQMLDLYAPEEQPGCSYARAAEGARHYSLNAIDGQPYAHVAADGLEWLLRHNRCEDPAVRLLWGGLRREVFGENPLLTKHTLVRNLPGVERMSHPHCAGNVHVADVTLCLRHHKLTGDWRRRDKASVAAGAWDHGEDRRRLSAASADAFRIAPAHPRRWQGTAALVEAGFLAASPAARAALDLRACPAVAPVCAPSSFRHQGTLDTV